MAMSKRAHDALAEKGFQWIGQYHNVDRSTGKEARIKKELGMKEKAHLTFMFQLTLDNVLTYSLANHSKFDICIGGNICIAMPKRSSTLRETIMSRVGRLQDKTETWYHLDPMILRNQQENRDQVSVTVHGNIETEHGLARHVSDISALTFGGITHRVHFGEVVKDPVTLSYDFRFLPTKSQRSTRASNDIAAKISFDGTLSLNDDIARAKNNNTTADMTIICEGKEFKAHTFMLSARSSVFSAMFSHRGTKEWETREVNVTDCHADIMEMFLQYIYTGTLTEATFEVAEKLIGVATKYDVQPLITACTEILIENLDEDNAIPVAILGDLYTMKDLKKEALTTIVTSRKPLKSMNGWNDLGKFQDLKIEIVDAKAT